METGRLRGGGGVVRGILKREIKAPPLVVPLTGVSCLQLGEGREGKVIFFCYVGLPISAPRGLTTAKNIR